MNCYFVSCAQTQRWSSVSFLFSLFISTWTSFSLLLHIVWEKHAVSHKKCVWLKYLGAVLCNLQTDLCLNVSVRLMQVLEAFLRIPKTTVADYSTHIKASSKSNLIYGCNTVFTVCSSAIPLLGNTQRRELYWRWRPNRPINSVALFLREPSCSFLTDIWSLVCWGLTSPTAPLSHWLSDFSAQKRMHRKAHTPRNTHTLRAVVALFQLYVRQTLISYSDGDASER